MALNADEIFAKHSMARQDWYASISDVLPYYERQFGYTINGTSEVSVKVPAAITSGLTVLQQLGSAEHGLVFASKSNDLTLQTRDERWQSRQSPRLYVTDADVTSVVNLAPNGDFSETRPHYGVYGWAGGALTQESRSYYTGNHFVMQRGGTRGPLSAYVDVATADLGFSSVQLYLDFIKDTDGTLVSVSQWCMDEDRNVFKEGVSSDLFNQTDDLKYYRVGIPEASTSVVGTRTSYRRFIVSVDCVQPYGWVKIISAAFRNSNTSTDVKFIDADDWIVDEACSFGTPYRVETRLDSFGRAPVGWKAANNYNTNTVNHTGQSYTSDGFTFNVRQLDTFGGYALKFEPQYNAANLVLTGVAASVAMTASVTVGGSGSAFVQSYVRAVRPRTSRLKTPLRPEAVVAASGTTNVDLIFSGTTVVVGASGVFNAGGFTANTLAGYGGFQFQSVDQKTSITVSTPVFTVNGAAVSASYGYKTWQLDGNPGPNKQIPAYDSAAADYPKSPWVTALRTFDALAPSGATLYEPSNGMWVASASANLPVTVCMDGEYEYIPIDQSQTISVSTQVYSPTQRSGVGGGGGNMVRISALYFSALPTAMNDYSSLIEVKYQDTNISEDAFTECRLDGSSCSSANVAYVKITLEVTSRDGGTAASPTSTLPVYSSFGFYNVCIAKDATTIASFAKDVRATVGFKSLKLIRDDTKIVNVISYETPAGVVSYLEPESIRRFGFQEKAVSTVAMPGAFLDGAGPFTLQQSLEPEDRIEEIRFVVSTRAQEIAVARLDIGDVVYFHVTPPGSSAIERWLRVEKIEIAVSNGNKSNEVTLTVSDASRDNGAIVGSNRLDYERVAF